MAAATTRGGLPTPDSASFPGGDCDLWRAAYFRTLAAPRAGFLSANPRLPSLYHPRLILLRTAYRPRIRSSACRRPRLSPDRGCQPCQPIPGRGGSLMSTRLCGPAGIADTGAFLEPYGPAT
jgi:hypothetical protein